jgi:glutamate formiminotransferase/formiminotetrahydrofolate cyclodeaminase
VELKARNLAQVSMNLTDFETTSLGTVFDAVAHEAAARGAGIVGSEIVGLVPRRALEDAAVHYLQIENFRPNLIIENRLAEILREQSAGAAEGQVRKLRDMAEGFVTAVAAPTPTPGGGSVSALAGALAAALGEMVCGLTLRRKSFAQHHATLDASRARLATLEDRLLENIDRDARSYEAVVAGFRLPKSTEPEQAVRAQAIEEGSKHAASVPLETAELAAETARLLETLRDIVIPQAASDLAVALALVRTAQHGAIENVRANLPSIQDQEWLRQMEGKLTAL